MISDDEVWFYYHGQYGGIPGCPGLTQPKDLWQCAIGIGVVRRDGFVSLEAGGEMGELITRPVVFSGSGTLCINAQSEKGGTVRAAVMEEDGTPIAGLDYADCAVMDGDSVRAPISWKGTDSIAALKGRYLRFGFHLEHSRIFSFWVD